MVHLETPFIQATAIPLAPATIQDKCAFIEDMGASTFWKQIM